MLSILFALRSHGRQHQDNAREILSVIQANPALNRSEIARQTELSISTVRHHLRQLARTGEAREIKHGGQVRVIPSTMPRDALEFLVAMRYPDSKKFLKTLHGEEFRQRDVSTRLNWARKRTRITWKRMLRANLIEPTPSGLHRIRERRLYQQLHTMAQENDPLYVAMTRLGEVTATQEEESIRLREKFL